MTSNRKTLVSNAQMLQSHNPHTQLIMTSANTAKTSGTRNNCINWTSNEEKPTKFYLTNLTIHCQRVTGNLRVCKTYFLKNVFKKCYSKINVQSMEKTQLLNTLIFISNKQYSIINQVALKYSFWKSHNISMIYCTIHIINMKLYSWT